MGYIKKKDANSETFKKLLEKNAKQKNYSKKIQKAINAQNTYTSNEKSSSNKIDKLYERD